MKVRFVNKHYPKSRHESRGASLIIVLIVLTIVSMLGVSAIQVSMMSERGARNDRDMQLAWQSAEAALIDAENDMYGPNIVSTQRLSIFSPLTKLLSFEAGCAAGTGLCSQAASGKPTWLAVDMSNTATDGTARSVYFGQFTGRSFASGAVGVQPAALPRYVIEAIPDPGDRDTGNSDGKYVYRVTAIGFGPRTQIQAVIQMIYRN